MKVMRFKMILECLSYHRLRLINMEILYKLEAETKINIKRNSVIVDLLIILIISKANLITIKFIIFATF